MSCRSEGTWTTCRRNRKCWWWNYDWHPPPIHYHSPSPSDHRGTASLPHSRYSCWDSSSLPRLLQSHHWNRCTSAAAWTVWIEYCNYHHRWVHGSCQDWGRHRIAWRKARMCWELTFWNCSGMMVLEGRGEEWLAIYEWQLVERILLDEATESNESWSLLEWDKAVKVSIREFQNIQILPFDFLQEWL